MWEIDQVQLTYLFDFKVAWENLPFLLEGVPLTLGISFAGMGIGLILGLFLALARGASNLLFRWPARIYISFMRGTPLIVFLFLLYYGLPVIGIEMSAIVAASLGFGLNSAAFIAEINRASLNSVDKGQWEAAKALNMGKWYTLRRIVLPQATRIAIPPLTNVFMSVVKGTSLAAIITVPELFQKSQIVAGRTLDSMTMYIMVAFIYWPICIIISMVQDRLEARYSRFL
ncbi:MULTISPECIES: ABC transporter permease subunit [unclassified Virgibacillus]|uniref:amino acid ABC transporter permease n=1 Tax=unclassified Virgibacillus TaxID=2620237 RepID=UPI0024DEA327|nr:ABC transporter permease subunit [Virgibacillus sp. LDC-1]